MQSLPLLAPADPARPVAYLQGRAVSLAEFCSHVQAIAQRLPPAGSMLNLCEDRYRFLVAYAAALCAGHPVLLPPSRAEQIVTEVANAHAGSYRWQDEDVAAALEESGTFIISAGNDACPQIPAERTVMIGCTSGSTGQPKSFPKLWRSMHGSSACNAAAIRHALGIANENASATIPAIVATVPPQHMYGMELSILLPLIGGMAVHAGRPLFPADIALALAELPAPRVLVSTPLHLRTLVESSQSFPQTALIVSATAPLDRELAAAVEARLGGQLLEMFGSTETCVIASRRTAVGDAWHAYAGVELHPRADGTLVTAPWFVEPILLQDIVELRDERQFVVRGRSSDMIEVAGKRASLADLTQRLLAVEGVRDAVLFQPQPDSVATIRRLAALVVAPGLSARQIRERLAASVDPAFLPRPLRIVDALPRNELGKLPRERLLEMLKEESG
ncbi:MAG TPA: AMP-binding protein [Steroidobacteraceae bacterium]|nr:AMP-binding protein [Steroidobacteraceae bacterium]